jgi:hypothetical protein
MDILGLVASGGGISAIVIFGVLGMALTVFIAGAALALKANRSAQESRLALADAEVKLAAAGDLAQEVRELRERVEEAVIHHDNAVAAARYQHNEACAPQAAYAQSEPQAHYADHGRSHAAHDAHEEHDYKGGKHDDHKKHHAVGYKKHDDDHKKHHSAAFKKHDDDHKKHHSAGFKRHDDDHKKHHSAGFKKHDGDHKKHHSAHDDEREHSGFLGWFFDR